MTYRAGNIAEISLNNVIEKQLRERGGMNTHSIVEVEYFSLKELIRSHRQRRLFMHKFRKLRNLITDIGTKEERHS